MPVLWDSTAGDAVDALAALFDGVTDGQDRHHTGISSTEI